MCKGAMTSDRGPVTHQFSCRATEQSVRQVLIQIRCVLSDAALSEDLQSTVEIAVAEGLNNIVEHAMPDMAQACIDIEMHIDTAKVCVSVEDPGAPFPGHIPPSAEVNLSVPVSDLPEGGFGWAMIHALAERVDVSRSNQKNRPKKM